MSRASLKSFNICYTYIEVINMPYNKSTSTKTIQRTLRIPVALNETIERLAIEHDRDFTKQVNHMLRKYLEIQDGFNQTSHKKDRDAM